jgi:hypothetical protein
MPVSQDLGLSNSSHEPFKFVSVNCGHNLSVLSSPRQSLAILMSLISKLISGIGRSLGWWGKGKSAPHEDASPGARTIPENRQLNAEERTLIEWLIANGVPEAGAFKQQLADLHVIGRCSCGCPTVDLTLRDSQQVATGPSQILADFFGVTPEGVQVGVILHARQDRISELEVYSLGTTDTTDRAFGLPRIETLKGLDWQKE